VLAIYVVERDKPVDHRHRFRCPVLVTVLVNPFAASRHDLNSFELQTPAPLALSPQEERCLRKGSRLYYKAQAELMW